MKLPHRRQLLHLAAGAAALPTVSRFAIAQTYPSRPVRWIVGYAPGGAADLSARLMAQSLSERLGQQFFIENRTGAGTNIATEAVVKATPDGHTLLMSSAANAINASLYEKLNFNFVRDIVSVAGIMRVPHVIVVHPTFLARTLPDLIAYAKTNPGKLAWASPGVGTAGHVCGELFKMMAGVDMVHVPYRGGGAAMADVLSGQLQVYIGAMTSSLEYVKAGRLRALAVSTATRSEALPEIARMGDFLPGFETSDWVGLGAPKGTPVQIIDKLNKEANVTFADPKIKARLADLGGAPFPGTPSEFTKFVVDETEKWGKVVKFAGLKPE
jgi:tripartite-type tricarboxylate transporter receptor subunit TctC